MKCIYLALFVFVLAANWHPLLADDEATTAEAPAESAAPEGEATTEEATTTTKKPTTKKAGAKGKTTTPAPGMLPQLDKDKIQALYKNLSKYFDATNKENSKMILDIATKFGSKIQVLIDCLGPGWIFTCRNHLIKCTFNPIPQLCIWKVACDGEEMCKKNQPKSTTSATTLSPARALFRQAMKNAGLQCDKLKECLRNMGLTVAKMIGEGLKQFESALGATTAKMTTMPPTTEAPPPSTAEE